MNRILKLHKVLLVILFVMITSPASAELNAAGSDGINSPVKNRTIRSAVNRLNNYNEFVQDWNNWYNSFVDKPLYLQLNDVFIGKLTMSRDNRLELRTPVSASMMTTVTFGRSGAAMLQDNGRPNLGLGISSRLSSGFSVDTSVNFDLKDPSDVTVWMTLPAIRF